MHTLVAWMCGDRCDSDVSGSLEGVPGIDGTEEPPVGGHCHVLVCVFALKDRWLFVPKTSEVCSWTRDEAHRQRLTAAPAV